MTFKPVVLQLNGDIVMPTLKDTFLDSSSNSFTVTKNGSVSQGTFSPFPLSAGAVYSPIINGGSAYFDRISSLAASVASATFLVGTTWTVEAWVNMIPGRSMYTLINGTPHSGIGINLNRTGVGDTHVYIGNGSAWLTTIVASSNLSFNTWHHIALVRNGSTVKLYQNGKEVASTTTTPTGYSGPLYIGSSTGGASERFKGYIANLRITNHAAYTTAFTPPTSPVTLTSNGGATPSTAPTAGQVSLFCDFTNGSVLDARGRNDLTLVGNAQVVNDTKQFGIGSLCFPSTNDKITIPTITTGSNLDFGTGSFTVEFWYRVVTVVTNARAITYAVTGNGNLEIIINTNGSITLYLGNVNLGTTATGLISLNTWRNIALVRNGTSVNVYVDGSSVLSATSSASIGAGMEPCINGYSITDGYGNVCYIDDLRITKGVARYPTQAFPTAALPNTSSGDTNFSNVSLLLQADALTPVPKDAFLDSSSNSFTIITRSGTPTQGTFSPFPLNGVAYDPNIHGGSGYFNGSSYLTVPWNTSLNFASGDFTLETFINPTLIRQQVICGIWDGLTTVPQSWWCFLDNTGFFNFVVDINGADTSIFTSSSVIPINTWTHVAVTRQGSTYRLFINGVLNRTAVNTGVVSAGSAPLYIGSFQNIVNPYNPFNGYISELRIVKGTALYTGSTLSVPVAPLTTVTNTSLLLNFTNSSIIDSTGKNDLTIFGDAKVSNTVKKFGLSSYYFDGSGDYILAPAKEDYNFGTGDFTIECWVRFNNTTTGEDGIMDTGSTLFVANANQWYLYRNGSILRFGRHGGINDLLTYNVASLPLSDFHHIAITKNGTQLSMFVNGTRVASIVHSGWVTDGSNVRIGAVTTPFYMNGWIDDVRLTKGVARYTGSTLTLPTTAYAVR